MSADQRMDHLLAAIWPKGFWCAKCGYRCERPWSRGYACGDGSRRGWRVECPACHTQVSMASEQVRTLMSHGTEAMLRVSLVCCIWGVSLFSILKRRSFDAFKEVSPAKIRACKQARSAIVRELDDLVSERDLANIFSMQPREVRAAMSAKATWQDVWKDAWERREKVRNRRERRRENNRQRERERVAKRRANGIGQG